MSIKEQNVVITSKDELNNTVIYKPYTDVSMVEGAVSSINNIVPDSNGNVTIDVPNTDSFAKKEDVYLYVGNDTPTKLTENLIVLNPNETQNVVMPTIKIGTVTTGTTSKVVNRGTYLNPILDFTLQKGDKGDKGNDGDMVHASSYIASVVENNGKVTVTKGDGVTNTFNSGLNILARNKDYEVGDIAYHPNLPSWAYLECITAGTTGDTEPTFTTGGVILNQEITDGTVVFSVKTKTNKEYIDSNYITKDDANSKYFTYNGGTLNGSLMTNMGCMVGGTKELGVGINIDGCIERCRYTNGCSGSVSIGNGESRVPQIWYNYLYIPHRNGGDGYGNANGDNCNYGTLLLYPMTANTQTYYRVMFMNGNIYVYAHS